MTVAFITSRRSTQYNADPPRANIVAILILIGSLAIGGLLTGLTRSPFPIIVMAIAGGVLMQAPRIAKQWERAVVLRLGRFRGLKGPGLFIVVPFFDVVSIYVDTRILTTEIKAEAALTKLSYLLGQGLDAAEVKLRMQQDLRGELTELEEKPRFSLRES